MFNPQTFGAGSFALQSAGNRSFSLSFSDLGLSKASEAEKGWKCIVLIFDDEVENSGSIMQGKNMCVAI